MFAVEASLMLSPVTVTLPPLPALDAVFSVPVTLTFGPPRMISPPATVAEPASITPSILITLLTTCLASCTVSATRPPLA